MPRGSESLSWNTVSVSRAIPDPPLTSIFKDFLSNIFIHVQKQHTTLIAVFFF